MARALEIAKKFLESPPSNLSEETYFLAKEVIRLTEEVGALKCKNRQMADVINAARYSMDLYHRTMEENERLRSDKPFVEMEDRIHSLENELKEQSEALREAAVALQSICWITRYQDDPPPNDHCTANRNLIQQWLAKYAQEEK